MGFSLRARAAPLCAHLGAMSELEHSASRLQNAVAWASKNLIERAPLVEAVVLGAVAGEHVLVVGPPGTAKSQAVRRIASALGGRYFEYLLGRFSEPSEIFGPVDLRRLREGVVQTQTDGMLPEAEIAFLDEVFQGSTAILNTLLGLLNERVFRRGHDALASPLRTCCAASNGLPDDPNLAAFADRFLLRLWVERVPDAQLEDLLEGGWQIEESTPALATLADVDALARAAKSTDMTRVRSHLAEALRLLRGAGVELSDRRAVKTQKLIAAAAVLDGRTEPDEGDLWPLVWAVPTLEGQILAREVLRDKLSRTRNRALPAASEEASNGPLARALRLENSARELLSSTNKDAAWKLKVEGVAREMDAAFSPDNRPASLAQAREHIVAALETST